MKKVGVVAGILLVLLIGSALVVPSFINWNEYKTEIETTASDLSDRKVAINGDLSLSILPSPSFSAKDVSVSNVEGGQATNFISLKSVDVNVAFFPLLSGEIQVTKFILVEPVVAVEIDADGKGNWEFGTQSDSPESESSYTDLSFEKFQIENGQLSYQDFSSGTQEMVRAINASVIMDSLQGPFEIKGDARYKNLPVSTDLMIGLIREGRKIPIWLNAGLLDNDVRIKFTGGFLPDDVSPQADGKINLEANDIGDMFLAIALLDLENTNQNGPNYNHPLSLESTVAYGGDAINISTLEFEMGESRGSGNMTATFGELTRFDGNLSVNSFNLDSFLPALEQNNDAAPAGENNQDIDYSFIKQLEGNFEFNLGALQYNDKIASQLELDMTASNGEIDFTNMKINMPGGSVLGMRGAISAPENNLHFGGNTTLNSGNLRAFLEWLKIDVSEIPAGRLTRLAYQGAVQVTPELVQLYGVEGTLDTFQFSGGVSYALQDRPSMGLDVHVANLNLDNYFPPEPEEEQDLKKLISMLTDFDANYKIDMANLTSGGITIKKMAVSGELFDGNLNAKTISIENYAGFDLNGSLLGNDLGGNPRFETSFNTTAASLVPLQRAFRFKTPYDIAEVGAVAVNARVTGDFEKLDVDLKSTVGSSKADIKGQVRSATLKQLPEIGSADLEIIASNPSLASLIEQFDLPINKPNASDDRSVGMTTTLKATEQLADIDGSFNVAGGTIMLKGRTNLSENEISTFDMTVDVNGPNVREFIRGLGVDFRPSNTDLGALSLTLAASGNMNDVSLKNIVGTAGPTKFTGAGELKDFNAEPDQGLKSAFDFTLVLDDVPVADFMEASAEVPEEEEWGNWSKEPMELAVLNDYDGRVNVTANSIIYDKYNFENPRFLAVLKDGVININNFTGKLFGGDVAIAGSFSSLGDLDMDMSLKNAAIVDATSSFAGINPITGFFDMTQRITGKGTSQDTLISSLNGTGAVTASSGTINGINIPELSERINSLSSQNGILGLLTSTLSGGQTPYKGGSSTLTTKNGFIQLSPFDINMLGASSDIDLGINLAQWKMNLTGDMSLSEHPDAPPIGISVLGALNDPEITYNTKSIEGFIGKKVAASLLQNMVEGNGGIGDLFGGVTGAQSESAQPIENSPVAPGDVPATNGNEVTSSPLDDFVNPPSEPSTEAESDQQAPAEEQRPESVEELGAKLLERLFQKPPPKN